MSRRLPAEVVRPDLTLVLDGGAARRMSGIDKALLPLTPSDTLLSLLLDRLAGQCGPIAISANGDPSRFAETGRPVLADTVGPGWGPLAGVLAGLERLATSRPEGWLLTVPGDTPLVPLDLAERLGRTARDGRSLCVRAASGGRHHSLVALWSGALRGPLRVALCDRGQRRVEAFQRDHGVTAVTWSSEPYDPFLNVNTPADLETARLIARGLRVRVTACGS